MTRYNYSFHQWMRISKQEDDMILSDRTMDKMIKEGTLVVKPITEGQIQPASIDIRLGNTFSIVDDTPSGIITLENEIKYKTITTDTYLIMPGQFVLATTMEYFELPDNLTELPSSLHLRDRRSGSPAGLSLRQALFR